MSVTTEFQVIGEIRFRVDAGTNCYIVNLVKQSPGDPLRITAPIDDVLDIFHSELKERLQAELPKLVKNICEAANNSREQSHAESNLADAISKIALA